MTKQEEYAKLRKCIYCDEDCSGARMHFHHDNIYECAERLKKQCDALKMREIPDEIHKLKSDLAQARNERDTVQELRIEYNAALVAMERQLNSVRTDTQAIYKKACQIIQQKAIQENSDVAHFWADEFIYAIRYIASNEYSPTLDECAYCGHPQSKHYPKYARVDDYATHGCRGTTHGTCDCAHFMAKLNIQSDGAK